MINSEKERYENENFVYESDLEEILTEEESQFLDNLIENKEVLDTMLVHLPPDMETELATAEDNALIDAMIDEIEAKSGRKLTDIERIELENEILQSLIEYSGEEE